MHCHANGTGGAGLPIGFQKQKCVLRTGLMLVKPDVYGGLDFPLFFAGSAYTKSFKNLFLQLVLEFCYKSFLAVAWLFCLKLSVD